MAAATKKVKAEDQNLATQDAADAQGTSTAGAQVDTITIRDLRAGRATFTVVTNQTDTSFTYRINRGENKPEHQAKYGKYSWYVKVLTGPNNEADYAYMGALTQDKNGVWIIQRTSASAIMSSAESWQVMAWLLRKLTRNEAYNYAKGARVVMAGYCLRCHIQLTREKSVNQMYGDWCYKEMLKGN